MRLNDWGMDDQGLNRWIHQCIELGVTSFDHADIYGSYTCEERFGKALALSPELRDKIELITKCGIQLISDNRPNTKVKHYNTTRDYIRYSLDRSLQLLGVNELDLLLIHRPDMLMDADEVAGALSEAVVQGKVKHVGVSNFTPAQFRLLQSRLDIPLYTNQVQYSVTHTEPLFDDTFTYLQEQRIAPMIWSPLGGGAIFTGQTEQANRIRYVFGELGSELGTPVSYDQLALAWVHHHPLPMIPVLGTGKIDRIQNAVKAESIVLNKQQWFRVLEASRGMPVA